MKILFLANRLPHSEIAGGHRLIYQRMRQLADRGHQVGLAAFVAPKNEPYIESLRNELFEVSTVPAKKNGSSAKSVGAREVFALPESLKWPEIRMAYK